jgi:hypothetical protein
MPLHGIEGFQFGEVSPKLYGRVGAPQYASACKTLENMFALPAGPAQKRPGTIFGFKGPDYVAAAQSQTGTTPCRLIPWYVSPTLGYVLAIGVSSSCVFQVSGTTPVNCSGSQPSWAAADLLKIDYVQIADVMYLVCAGFAPVKITRTVVSLGADTFDYAALTWTAGAGFIDFATPAANYPATCEVIQNRLVLGNTTGAPSTIWASVVGSPTNFTGGTTTGAEAWTSNVLPSNKDTVLWVKGNGTLCCGGATAPVVLAFPDTSSILSSKAFLDVGIAPLLQGSIGSAAIKALVIESGICFVQSGYKKIRAFAAGANSRTWDTVDLTAMADHITVDGVYASNGALAFQRVPESILWAVLSDGSLISLVSSKTMGASGWSKHELTGDVKSICVVPTADEDQVWVTVERDSVYHVERFASHEFTDMVDAHFVDSGVVVGPLTVGGVVTSINEDEPIVTTVDHHGFADDELVRFADVEDLTFVNGRVFKVSDKTDHTFKLKHIGGTSYYDLSPDALDPEAASALPGAGGTVIEVTNAVAGLGHLEGLDVTVTIDGIPASVKTVASGAVSVTGVYGNTLRAGLVYTAKCAPMDVWEQPNKLKRIKKVLARFYRSAGCSVGPDATNTIDFRFSDDTITMDEPPDLVSEFIALNFPGSASYTPGMVFISSDPVPLTILAAVVEWEPVG